MILKIAASIVFIISYQLALDLDLTSSGFFLPIPHLLRGVSFQVGLTNSPTPDDGGRTG